MQIQPQRFLRSHLYAALTQYPLSAVQTELATPDDALSPGELRDITKFLKEFVSNPTIDPPYDKLPPEAQQARQWALQQPNNYAQDDDYMAEISAREYAAKHSLGNIPLIVLTRGKYDYPPQVAEELTKEHKEQQARMAQLSSRGEQILVPDSGHAIHIEAPGKVVDAIRTVIERSRPP